MRIITLLLQFFAFGFIAATAQTKPLYIKRLFSEKDFFRAIGVLKEEDFFSQEEHYKNICRYLIGYAYLQSGKNHNAREYYYDVLGDSSSSQYIKVLARMGVGLSFLNERLFSYSEMELAAVSSREDSNKIAQFYLGLLQVEQKKYIEASSIYANLSTQSPHPQISLLSKAISDSLKKVSEIPHYSPLGAGLLSSFIPGAGQVYTQHYFDGVQAFGFIAAFGYATYASYQYNHSNNNSQAGTIAIGVIAGFFHASNILGAIQTAQYRNIRADEDFISKIRGTAFSVDLSIPLLSLIK